ncbi:MAG: DUF3995 domain-containing protein [Fibrobacterales bacterium]
MTTVLSIALMLILLIVALIHCYWAFGGNWAIESTIPSKNGIPLFKPGVGGTLFVAIILVGISLALLMNAQLFFIAQIESSYVSCFLTVISIVFIIRSIGDFRYVGFFKKVTSSSFAFWDSRFFSPAFMIMGLCIGYVAYFG